MLVALAVGWLVGAPLSAADAVWQLPPTIGRHGEEWTGPWRFQPGDDPAWSAPAFDDAAWPTGKSSEVPRVTPATTWTGRGWFRLRLDTRALPERTSLLLAFEQAGGAEVFLDGRRIATLGRVGASLEDEQAVLRNEIPPLAIFEPGRVYVLAVRYSNFYARPLGRLLPDTGGFKVSVMPPAGWTADALAWRQEKYGTLMFFTAVPLLLAAIHLALFVFLPRSRESLYCALFMCTLSLLTYTRLERQMVDTVVGYLLMHRMWVMAIVAFSLFSLLTIYAMFARPRSGWFKTLLFAGLALLVWPFFEESAFSFRVCAAFGFVVSLETLRIAFLAVRARRDGAGLVLGGMILFGLAVIHNAVRIVYKIGDDGSAVDTMNLGILAAATGMSLFISRNYALTTRRLEQKLVEVEDLSRRNLEQEREKQAIVAAQNEKLEVEVRERTAELRVEKGKSDDLLANILPREVAAELKERGVSTPRRYEEVTILFSDFSGFTSTVSAMPAHRLVRELDEIFRLFDEISEREGLEKIKTIGDAYMAASGLPEQRPDHAQRAVRAALAMQAAIAQRNLDAAIKWHMRAGLHTGPVVAGVVGKRKFTYDVFGDTVNLASRMETSAEPGQVNLSAYCYDLVRGDFVCDYRGKLDIKGKGQLDLYTVRGPKTDARTALAPGK